MNRGADLLDRALFPFSCVPTKIVTLIWWAAISRIAGLPEGRDKAAASQPPVKCGTRALARQHDHTPRYFHALRGQSGLTRSAGDYREVHYPQVADPQP